MAARPGPPLGHRDLYALDLPGHGDTPVRPDATGPEASARLVIAFADRLGLERFDLNGHSRGAAVAILVAARWPERVSRLVLTRLGTTRNALERLALTQAYHQMSLAMALWRPWLAMFRPWLALSRLAIDWFGARIRNVREAWLDDCGHLPMIEQPDAYHRLKREFLGRVDGGVQDRDSSAFHP